MVDTIEVKELDQKRFEALAGHSRSPAAAYISIELSWYTNKDESVIGVVLLDKIDDDFAAVILGRDEIGAFRAFDQIVSLGTQSEAVEWVTNAIKWHTGRGTKVFPQGDRVSPIDLFNPVIPLERQHPYFTILAREPAFLPARSIINEIMPHFVDVDGNFVEQFQSTGFDARLWELYIDSYLTEEQLFKKREHNAPDFIVQKYGHTVAIEAVIVGRKADNPPRYYKRVELPFTTKDILDEQANAMPIRFGSPLFSKLQKKYWTLPHVANNPLVFAIADFHDDQSMLWSGTALIDYLYGVRHEFTYDKNGSLIISPIKVTIHKVGEKEIPSGFFFQTEAEYVSAILFSASGTISKFNRIGRQAGFSHPDVAMIRFGTCHDHDPNACLPKMFSYIVDESRTETWGEGMSMFHNPNSLYPVPKELFPSIAHHYFDNGQIVSYLPEFHPYTSVTYNIRPMRDNGQKEPDVAERDILP